MPFVLTCSWWLGARKITVIRDCTVYLFGYLMQLGMVICQMKQTMPTISTSLVKLMATDLFEHHNVVEAVEVVPQYSKITSYFTEMTVHMTHWIIRIPCTSKETIVSNFAESTCEFELCNSQQVKLTAKEQDMLRDWHMHWSVHIVHSRHCTPCLYWLITVTRCSVGFKIACCCVGTGENRESAQKWYLQMAKMQRSSLWDGVDSIMTVINGYGSVHHAVWPITFRTWCTDWIW